MSQLEHSKYLIVDVGCRGGDLHRTMNNIRSTLTGELKYIGIDPSHSPQEYDELYHIAVDNVSERIEKTLYVNPTDSGCNSLLPMNIDLITHDKDDYQSKWYVAASIEKNIGTEITTVDSLYNVLMASELFQEIGYVHYLKIDAQGVDIRVVRSLGDLIEKTYIVQIESVVSANDDIVMYDGQQHYNQDILDMKEMGFDEWFKTDYSIDKKVSPEADVVFVNRKFKL